MSLVDSDAGSDEVMESEDGQLYRLEIKNRRRILTKSLGRGSHKGGGKEGKTDTECFWWFPVRARLTTSELDCRAKADVNGGPLKSARPGNGWELPR